MKPSAFSLVELSIVLVILGLLVGGILAGQSLIHAAELRSVTTSVDKYKTAMFAFRDKYFQLPGDMSNATSFWGTGASCRSNTTGGTCNGNGDGFILCSPDYTGCEITYATQHLALAGLIEGSINPNWPATSTPLTSDYLYATKYKQAGLVPSYNNPYAAVYYDNFGNKTYIRAALWKTLGYYSGYATTTFPCEDAWNLDTKMDDGKPGTGKVVGPRSFCTTDTTGANYASAAYNLASTSWTYLEVEF